MVKQKIVIKLAMEDAKRRSKALKIVVGFSGVTSTSLEGEDKIVVIGDGIDSIALTTALRKRMCHAELMSVGEEKKKEEKASSNKEAPTYYVDPMLLPYRGGVMQSYPNVYHDPTYDPNSCNIM
ncbi:heavy metal-associated isoprenylated plant protein 47-like [Typha angustifolia]|uniref:heavy metal-associated isoprenylated plant protein 47-like n=1 Tax=Typha angustifolia TaxID=59011 RepID=UPI003C2E5F5B